MLRRMMWVATGLLVVGGCSDGPTAPPAGDGRVDTGLPQAGIDAGPVDGGESFTIGWGPVTAEPGEEGTRCVVKRLSNEASIRVGSIENRLGNASHHMIVYRTDDAEEQPDPFQCTPFVDTLDPTKGAPLTVSQVEETVQFPAGVAFTLAPSQMIRLELHYINTTPKPIEVTATSTFHTISDDTFEHEADFLFIGDIDISLAPRESITVGPTYFPLPSEFAEANFFSLTGHTHQHGTNVEIAITDSAAGSDTTVYAPAPFLWDEPESVSHDPPFQIPNGGGFRFHCDYTNTSDQSVGFGEGFNDEMCFFWAYYYPSVGARVCAQTDDFDGVTLCCPGSPLCGALLGAF